MRDRLPSGKKLLLIYLLLLGVSHAVKQFRSDTGPLAAEQVRENIGDIQVAYKDIPADDPGSPTLVLLHGSPVDSSCWDNFIAEVRGRYRIIVPDLPGFGGSTREVENYSIESHAQQLDKLLASLDVLSAHVLGYSMGGGVALELFDETPQRVDSLTLVSSIGVQELELLGDYTLNHAVHGAQLFYFWLFYNFTPNFGLLDDSLLNLSYCKNFYETDQRPLRNIMGMIDVPTLILHGEKDVLVPFAAAKEHARLIPHAQTEFFADKGHMFLFSDPELVAQSIAPFINSTESGHAPRRADS
ncbi:MAG: pimeloyl-ACP methyl ester carboxylesterase, partial [Verrucomicrobiales bacterium]